MVNEEQGVGIQFGVTIIDPDSGSASVRMVGFGVQPHATILLETGFEDENTPFFTITAGGGPTADAEGVEELAQLFELVADLLRQPGVADAVEAAAADEAIEQAYEDDDAAYIEGSFPTDPDAEYV